MASKAHGRLESATLVCFRGGCADWRWLDVAQVIEHTCEREVRRKRKRTRGCDVSYALTSLAAEELVAAGLETLWRGHWMLEGSEALCARRDDG